MVPSCVSDPTGCAFLRRTRSTPAMNVVATAPMPTVSTPKFSLRQSNARGLAHSSFLLSFSKCMNHEAAATRTRHGSGVPHCANKVSCANARRFATRIGSEQPGRFKIAACRSGLFSKPPRRYDRANRFGRWSMLELRVKFTSSVIVIEPDGPARSLSSPDRRCWRSPRMSGQQQRQALETPDHREGLPTATTGWKFELRNRCWAV